MFEQNHHILGWLEEVVTDLKDLDLPCLLLFEEVVVDEQDTILVPLALTTQQVLDEEPIEVEVSLSSVLLLVFCGDLLIELKDLTDDLIGKPLDCLPNVSADQQNA